MVLGVSKGDENVGDAMTREASLCGEKQYEEESAADGLSWHFEAPFVNDGANCKIKVPSTIHESNRQIGTAPSACGFGNSDFAPRPDARMVTTMERNGKTGLLQRKTELLRRAELAESALLDQLEVRSSPRVGRLIQALRRKLFDPELRINRLVDELGLSFVDAVAFHAESGYPVGEFIARLRLRVAHRLITSTRLTIHDVWESVGFESKSAFYRKFKAHFGQSPGSLRKSDTDSSLGLPGGGLKPKPRRHAFVEWRLRSEPFEQVAVKWIATTLTSLPHHEALAHLRLDMACDSPALFEELCRQSRALSRRNRRQGVELAQLALASVEGSASALGEEAELLRALGRARLGQARRLANDHPGCERDLTAAEEILSAVPGPWPAIRGEIQYYRGSLRLFQRRFAEAREWLLRARALLHAAKATSLEAQAWMQLAAVALYQGDLEGALMPQLKAYRLAETDLGGDPFLRLGISSQLAYLNAETGQLEEAERLLPGIRQLAGSCGIETASLQADWIEAIIHRGRGNAALAEKALGQARAGFIRMGDVGNTAIASLDLALLLDEQGRIAEVMDLAADALPALEELQIPEALEAYGILGRAIAREEVARSLLEKTRRIIFRPSSGGSSREIE